MMPHNNIDDTQSQFSHPSMVMMNPRQQLYQRQDSFGNNSQAHSNISANPLGQSIEQMIETQYNGNKSEISGQGFYPPNTANNPN